MNEIIILDGSEVKLNESKSGKLTIIAGENASIPLSLLPAFKKRDVTVRTVKDLKDPCEIAFALGQIFKPGDVLITSRPEFARFKEYTETKPVKVKAKVKTKETVKHPAAPTTKPRVVREYGNIKEAPMGLGKTEPALAADYSSDDLPDDLPFDNDDHSHTSEGGSSFDSFLKTLNISTAYNAAAKNLFKLAIDDSSLRILAQSDLKGLPAETAKKIIEKIKEMKKI